MAASSVAVLGLRKTRLRSSFTKASPQSSLSPFDPPFPDCFLKGLLIWAPKAKHRSTVTKILASSPVPCSRTSFMRSTHAALPDTLKGVSDCMSRVGLSLTDPPAHMRRDHGSPGLCNGSVPSGRRFDSGTRALKRVRRSDNGIDLGMAADEMDFGLNIATVAWSCLCCKMVNASKVCCGSRLSNSVRFCWNHSGSFAVSEA